MKYYFVAVFFLLSGLMAHSQKAGVTGRIFGRVMDSTSKKAIDYATITVFLPNATKPLTGSTTNQKGVFTLDNLAPGTYKVVVEFIGYHAKTISNIVLDSKVINKNLGDITISGGSQTLESVTVTAKTGLIENKIDKMIYNAEKDLTSQGGMATDILKKVPQVSVDVDGNVELQGSSNIRFLIDGKPSTVFGNNLADALQSLPASLIKSIEVITSPGAKYDAEGTGGIINIILKKSTIKGINGSVNLSAGSRLENGSVNLNARRGKFGVHGFFSGNGQVPSHTPTEQDRYSVDTASKTTSRLLQDGRNDWNRKGYEGGVGFDWDITRKDNLSGTIGYDHYANISDGFSNQRQTVSNFGSTDFISDISNVRKTHRNTHSGATDWNLNYKKKFNDDQELDVQYNTSTSRNYNNYSQFQFFTANDSTFSGLTSNNPGKEYERNFQVDYTQPITDNIGLELGGKSVRRSFNSNSDVFSLNPSTGQYAYDTRQSNALRYSRDVYAMYASISFPVFKFLDIKAGGRFEHTTTNADYSSVGKVNVPGYGSFVPSLYISHKLDDQQVVKISYSRRIQRPGYRDLNPFVNAIDPKNISTGNPTLTPEISDKFETGYSTSFSNGGSVNISLFYRRNNHDIQPYVVYYPEFLVGDSLYKNVSVSTSENIGLEKNVGINLYGSMPVTSKLNLRSNVSAFHRNIINRFVPGDNITSLNYRLNLNATYQVTKDLTAEFFGNFSSAHNEVQGKMPSFTTYNFAFRKMVLNRKGSIGFTTTNPFNKYVDQLVSLKGPNFTLMSLKQIPFRSFGISFLYKFGKLEFKKEVDDNSEPKEVGAPN
jgi:ferric enterobactin receptor